MHHLPLEGKPLAQLQYQLQSQLQSQLLQKLHQYMEQLLRAGSLITVMVLRKYTTEI